MDLISLLPDFLTQSLKNLAHYSAFINVGCYYLLLILCLSAICYYCYGVYAVIDFCSQPTTTASDFQPPISVLKPICGLDIDTYETLNLFAYKIIQNMKLFSVCVMATIHVCLLSSKLLQTSPMLILV